MRLLWEVLSLFICLILSRFNAVTCVIYVENGKSVTLNPNIQGQPEDILWTFNGNKLAEHDMTEFQDYGQFKGRSKIEISTGQLTVHAMTAKDSGVYRSVIEVNAKLQNSENEVQVIDALQEPNVTCQLNDTSQLRVLFCSVSSQFHVSYEWTGSSSAPQPGQELHISREEKSDSVYTCTVKNEVSKKSSNITLKDCDTDEPQSYQNIILLVALTIVAAVIVAAVIVAVVCCVQQGRNKGDCVIADLPQDNLIDMSESTRTEEPNEDQTLLNSNDVEEHRDQEVNDSGVRRVVNGEANRIDEDDDDDEADDDESERDGGINEVDEQEADEEQVRCEEASSRNTVKSAAPDVNKE